jgi:hypothetical protein
MPGQTLWEMFTSKLGQKTAQAPAYYNPLDCQIGSAVLLDETAQQYQGYQFSVQSILETNRNLNGQVFKFTDYVLLGNNVKGEQLTLRLRCVPLHGAQPQNGASQYSRILLKLEDEFKYDPGFIDVVNDESGEFNISDDKSEEQMTFERINGTKGSFSTVVRELTATKAEGAVAPDKETHFPSEYWDFWRDGKTGKEYVFVELSTENGWIQIWRGADYLA